MLDLDTNANSVVIENIKVKLESWERDTETEEAGIAVLFACSPGTGKTMATEVLAVEMDLPVFCIDLSQVVNKYIGEIDKNLECLFHAADISDLIQFFFNEADSFFRQRTEARDSHDRYTNLEISYLHERMDRSKGLAVQATNRKKDLDEAFLRRLGYFINIPFLTNYVFALCRISSSIRH